MEQKPSIGRIVIYNHPGSADGKYPPMQSPAIVQTVHPRVESKMGDDTYTFETVDLFVMSVTGGIFFAKEVVQKQEGVTGTSWEWPKRV